MVVLRRDPPPVDLVAAIAELRRQRQAVIIAHYYQEAAIQDIADFVGDSLQMARWAAATAAPVIVVCGVHFMAETAKILAMDRIVVIPDREAGCSLADSAPAEAFRDFVAAHPGHRVVTYVNSSAAVKALSDICCTSSNAVAVVASIPRDQPVIFAPDRYLGDWVARQTGRPLVLWQGSCEVHERFSAEALRGLQRQHPGAITLAHPECPAAVLALADVVGSTRRLLEAVAQGPERATWIVATEPGIVHQMRRVRPQGTFLLAPAEARNDSPQGGCSHCNECPHMKRHTLEKLWRCLRDLAPRIELDPELAARARLPIERMLAIG
ncbi:MAG: quinolinate synthase NadA [Planctomycetota bacterium]|nr:quinolinate synthase NadA [Planctomycetota bacterium]MCX8039251.1 quinolinate synthase NadA [Planctomycetota bacterium]MDW8372640.1 quinolinate synthase NadA [Planctomycetota bacterium]